MGGCAPRRASSTSRVGARGSAQWGQATSATNLVFAVAPMAGANYLRCLRLAARSAPHIGGMRLARWPPAPAVLVAAGSHPRHAAIAGIRPALLAFRPRPSMFQSGPQASAGSHPPPLVFSLRALSPSPRTLPPACAGLEWAPGVGRVRPAVSPSWAPAPHAVCRPWATAPSSSPANLVRLPPGNSRDPYARAHINSSPQLTVAGGRARGVATLLRRGVAGLCFG